MVAEDKENGTLRILKSQGVSWPELILGRTLGLISIASLIFTPTLIISAILLLFEIYQNNQYTILLNLIVLLIAYTIYFSIVAILALIVSTISGNKNIALMRLIGIWLLFTLILPKVSQVIAYNFYPSPSKIEFDSAVENDIIKLGDSHNPNDPYFKSLKDSLLKSYHVDSTHKLPFNFSGFIMREGEKLSAKTYLFHKNKLTKTYIDQQNIIRLSALINPFIAIKNISMAFTGTDYFAFNHFQNQTEDYRFRLAQYMNNLQIKYIGNKAKTSADKNSKINKSHWQNLPDFSYHFLSFRSIIYNEIYSIISLIIWLLITLLVVFTFPEKFKFI
jgi:ABC-2 type transport system permease protein